MKKQDLSNIKEKDLYSLMLYAIYKCTGDSQYATISELIYTLDKASLLKFCSIYGGTTFKVPTLLDLKIYTSALLIYQLVQEGKTFSEAFLETGLDITYRLQVAKIYRKFTEIIDGFNKD